MTTKPFNFSIAAWPGFLMNSIREPMITVMKNIPSYVAGFTASGDVTKNDYENVLIPRIEEVYKEHGHKNGDCHRSEDCKKNVGLDKHYVAW